MCHGIGDCFVGTIHSFANRIFKNSGENYRLLTEEVQDQFAQVWCSLHATELKIDSYLKYKETKKYIDLGKLSPDNLDIILNEKEKYELNVFFGIIEDDTYKENLETLCRKNNVITFNELIRRTTEYFKEIGGKVEYLFVDEYQDIGTLEKDFFEALNADNYFLVGDEKQGIYSFKGRKCRIFH